MGDKKDRKKLKLSELEEARLEYVGAIVASAVAECDRTGEDLVDLIADATQGALASFWYVYGDSDATTTFAFEDEASYEDDDDFDDPATPAETLEVDDIDEASAEDEPELEKSAT